jgi:hypothetical protein
VPARPEQSHGLLVHGRSLIALAGAGDAPDDTCQRELKRLLRGSLDALLGDKPLKTRQVLGSMKH